MAENVSPHHRIPDRAKLAVVPVLLSVLLYVLNGEEAGPSSQTDPSPAASTEVAPTAAIRRSIKAPDLPQRRRQAWPVLPLDEIVDSNPFAYPIALRPLQTSTVGAETPPTEEQFEAHAEQSRRQKLLRDWQAIEPTVIYRSKLGTVALIGTQVIKEGDVLDDVVQVLSVDNQGVVFALVTE